MSRDWQLHCTTGDAVQRNRFQGFLPRRWRGHEIDESHRMCHSVTHKLSEGGSSDSLVYTRRCGESPTSSPQAGALAYVISLRHRFFRDRRVADSGFQAGAVDPMQWSMRMAREISFAFHTLGKEIGE
jgi:hypothetical protein